MSKESFAGITQVSTLVDLLHQRAINHPDKLAYKFLVDGDGEEVSLTYEELDRQAQAIGAHLQSMGVTGERGLLLFPPGLDFIAAFFGCLYAGVVAVPAYPPDPIRLDRTLPRFRAIIDDSQPVVVLTLSPILSIAKPLFTQDPDHHVMQWLAIDTIPNTLAEKWHEPMITSDDLAFLQYTSGSTASPKGVMVSHGNILYNEQMIKTGFEHTEQSTFVGWLPLYHDMGLIGNVLQPLYINSTAILMSPLHFLQRPFRWLNAISKFKARTSGAPNFAYDLCVRKISPEQRATLDLSSWEIAFNGAEPVHPQTLERFIETFEPAGFRREVFYPCYGLAEATLCVSASVKTAAPIYFSVDKTSLEQGKVIPSKENPGHRLVACGRSWLDQQIAIVDPETKTQCPPDRIGEIWVSGPNVAKGYWNRPEETKQTFQAFIADSMDGPFLRTGDLGFMKDGELFITGRIKDLIIIDGLNHYPQDIEQTVEQSHPALRPGCSAAFSIEGDRQECLVVVAEVATKEKIATIEEIDLVELDQKTLINTIRRSISQVHNLQAHDIILLRARSIPKTSSGKIQRHACRDNYLLGTLERWEI